jgi:HicA toxin of bacterial toxin-antitoxin,
MVLYFMNSKHSRTLESIFARPVPANIRWQDIEALFMALGATRSEGRGSRVRFLLNGIEASFHRPHPKPDTNKGAVVSSREFLTLAGCKP